MKLLDLFCGAGGCSVGYTNAGFKVLGVDKVKEPNYPYEMIVSDVFELDIDFEEFDIIHASPPCQAYSVATKNLRKGGKVYSDLLGRTQGLLAEVGKPFIIENVGGAKRILTQPLLLCGTMFGLRVIRHRFFENGTDVWVYPPTGCNHCEEPDYYLNVANQGPVGQRDKDDEGNIMSEDERRADRARRAREYFKRVVEKYKTKTQAEGRYLDWCDGMDIHWMNTQKHARNMYDMTQAIPPAYTEHIGKFLIENL